MSEPIIATTPCGHVTITARSWDTSERPQVIAGLRQVISSLYLAFPELLVNSPTGGTFTETATERPSAAIAEDETRCSPTHYDSPTR